LKGRHELFLRARRKLVSRSGYQLPSDSLQEHKPGSFYLGDANRFFLRYSFKGSKHLGIGLTADKDEGEIFFKPVPGLSPLIEKQIPAQWGFDFYSAHLEVKDIGILQSLIIGDYHTRFGQGLTLWTGTVFKGGTDPAAFKQYAAGIKPNTSSFESRFMRGVALRLQRKKLDLCLFYSKNSEDASIISPEGSDEWMVTSISDAGYHRTLNEIQKKNILQCQHFGGHFSISSQQARIGLTAYHSFYEYTIQTERDAAHLFQFNGKRNLNAGVDYEIIVNKIVLYGEISASMNGGWALLSGLSHTSRKGSVMAVEFREYKKEYQNMLSAAYGNRSNNANEKGIRIAMKIPLAQQIGMQLYAEYIFFPWLTTNMINPYRALKQELILDYKPGNKTTFIFKYRHKHSVAKSTDNLNWFDQLLWERNHKASLRIRHMLSSTISINSQADYVNIQNEMTPNMHGSMLSIDLHYHPLNLPLNLTFRYAMYSTNDYGARLYAYEHDVLYASSFPAYYGEGFRTYLLLKYSPAHWLDTWFRFALSGFNDRNEISSGTDKISGNKVPELKLQLRIKIQKNYRNNQ
jgi:hypothetical protein